MATLLSWLAVAETLPWAHDEVKRHASTSAQALRPRYPTGVSAQPSTREMFALMSWGDRRMAALCQAGLVEKFVDALVWAFWPVYMHQRGVDLPGISRGDPSRVALEAYPGLVMRAIAQARGEQRAPSYKNDAPGKQTPAQRDARAGLLRALVSGAHRLRVRAALPRALAEAAVEDATGDTLDAIACAVQAAWGAARAAQGYGIPRGVDPVEGWIAGA